MQQALVEDDHIAGLGIDIHQLERGMIEVRDVDQMGARHNLQTTAEAGGVLEIDDHPDHRIVDRGSIEPVE